MTNRKARATGLHGGRSFHVHALDPFSISAIKYLAWAEGKTIPEVIEWLLDDDLINQYPDLARARDQQQFQRDMEAARHGISMGSVPGGEG